MFGRGPLQFEAGVFIVILPGSIGRLFVGLNSDSKGFSYVSLFHSKKISSGCFRLGNSKCSSVGLVCLPRIKGNNFTPCSIHSFLVSIRNG